MPDCRHMDIASSSAGVDCTIEIEWHCFFVCYSDRVPFTCFPPSRCFSEWLAAGMPDQAFPHRSYLGGKPVIRVRQQFCRVHVTHTVGLPSLKFWHNNVLLHHHLQIKRTINVSNSPMSQKGSQSQTPISRLFPFFQDWLESMQNESEGISFFSARWKFEVALLQFDRWGSELRVGKTLPDTGYIAPLPNQKTANPWASVQCQKMKDTSPLTTPPYLWSMLQIHRPHWRDNSVSLPSLFIHITYFKTSQIERPG